MCLAIHHLFMFPAFDGEVMVTLSTFFSLKDSV